MNLQCKYGARVGQGQTGGQPPVKAIICAPLPNLPCHLRAPPSHSQPLYGMQRRLSAVRYGGPTSDALRANTLACGKGHRAGHHSVDPERPDRTGTVHWDADSTVRLAGILPFPLTWQDAVRPQSCRVKARVPNRGGCAGFRTACAAKPVARVRHHCPCAEVRRRLLRSGMKL